MMIAISQNQEISRRGAQVVRSTERGSLLAAAMRVLGRVSQGSFDLTINFGDFATGNLPIVQFWRDGI